MCTAHGYGRTPDLGGHSPGLRPAPSLFPWESGQGPSRAGLCMSKRRGQEVRRAHPARSQGDLSRRGEPWTSFSPPGWRLKTS